MNELPTQPKAEVIPLGRHPGVFPIHCEALHPEHGWVVVDAVDDNRRLVRWYVFEDIPESEFAERFSDEPVIDAQDISSFTAWVDIHTLRQVDAKRDRPQAWRTLARFDVIRRSQAIRHELERRVASAQSSERRVAAAGPFSGL